MCGGMGRRVHGALLSYVAGGRPPHVREPSARILQIAREPKCHDTECDDFLHGSERRDYNRRAPGPEALSACPVSISAS